MSRYASINPATAEVVREFPTMTDAEVETALATAGSAYAQWRRRSLEDRAAVIGRVAELHRERAEEFAALMTLEMGKPVAQALGEMKLAISIYEYYATKGPDLLTDETLDVAGSGRAVVRTAPIGPLLGIMPWNYPAYQVARFAAPNLLLGNTILLKHAPSCPQQALLIDEILRDAGASDGAYQNVFPSNEQVAGMIADPRLQGVSLTGSERAGRIIGGLAGQNLKKCVLELGGSDPFIVLADADVDQAVSAAIRGRYGNAGQACIASKRIIAEEPVWETFLEGFLSKAAQWQMGDPTSDRTRLGPLSSVAARDEVAAQVSDAVEAGASVLLGGEKPDGPGAYYPATVLTGVRPGMRAYYEEIFGPVAVLHRVSSADEATTLANDTPFGLGGSVFTTDPARADQIADLLDVGMVAVNSLVPTAAGLPFGGVKNSGIGRELGRFGLDEFANKKLVHTTPAQS